MKYAGNVMIFNFPNEDEYSKVYDSAEELFADYAKLGMKFESPTQIYVAEIEEAKPEDIKTVNVVGTSWSNCRVVIRFSKSAIAKVVEEINSNKNDDLSAHIMYDTSDCEIWVDFLMSGESKIYESRSIHEIEWNDFDYTTIEITGQYVKINAEALEYYFVNRLGYEVI